MHSMDIPQSQGVDFVGQFLHERPLHGLLRGPCRLFRATIGTAQAKRISDKLLVRAHILDADSQSLGLVVGVHGVEQVARRWIYRTQFSQSGHYDPLGRHRQHRSSTVGPKRNKDLEIRIEFPQ